MVDLKNDEAVEKEIRASQDRVGDDLTTPDSVEGSRLLLLVRHFRAQAPSSRMAACQRMKFALLCWAPRADPVFIRAWPGSALTRD
jgi:hypothetical protein